MNRKHKRFLDTVHGYISIPEAYCDKIIDTHIFQRLRRIEQTSARSIFPCARHDRFIHSIGVFHIGSKIFHRIRSSYPDNDIAENDWLKIEVTYKLACLLHDCGHAPFSHTFEKYYDKPAKLTGKLKELSGDEAFIKDLDSQLEGAEHERLSAILLLLNYKNIIEEWGGDPLLAARMIIGCKFITGDLSVFQKISNCFISLLHGKVIDADRLDYVCRDKWASGYSSNNVDVERLINSISIKKNEGTFMICYDKSALNEIQSVLDVKDFQQLWVINHHKVCYDQFILDKAIERMAELICPEIGGGKEAALSSIFNYESFLNPIKVGEYSIYMPSDDDLVYLLKQTLPDNAYAKEWLSRQHTMIPLWKSQAEFYSYFGSNIGSDVSGMEGWLFKSSKNMIAEFLRSKGIEQRCEYIKATPKIKPINKNDIFINIRGKHICYTLLNIPQKREYYNSFFFYIYIPLEAEPYKDSLILNLANRIKDTSQ